MHALNMSVFAENLRDDRTVWAKTPEAELQLIVNKGVDGIFGDYPNSLFFGTSILGSQSNWPESPTPSLTYSRVLEVYSDMPLNELGFDNRDTIRFF